MVDVSKMPQDSESKIPYTEFVQGMILALREEPYDGIHTVYSGFNEQFRQYYGEEPRPVIEKLEKEGLIKLFPKKGGPVILLACDYTPGTKRKQGKDQKSAAVAAKAKQAQAKAKAKVRNPRVGEFTEQVRRNSQAHSRRSVTIHYKLCNMLATGEISREEALEVLRTMEGLAWSSLDRITQWVEKIEGNADA